MIFFVYLQNAERNVRCAEHERRMPAAASVCIRRRLGNNERDRCLPLADHFLLNVCFFFHFAVFHTLKETCIVQ
jgi:hypothetical protein